MRTFIYKSTLSAFNFLPVFIRSLIIQLVRFLRLPNAKFYKDLKYIGQVKVYTGSNYFRIIAAGGTIENELFWKGLNHSLEPETIWIWKLLAIRAKTVIDIGANTGIYSLLTKAINPPCSVYSFEPSKTTFAKLVKNIEMNHFDIDAFQLAISNKNSESVFYDVFDEHQTSASLSPKMLKDNPGYTGALNEYKVKTITFDRFVEENNITTVDLIKVDVELHEPEVFEGMQLTIEKMQPIIVFEVLLPEIADRLNEFFYMKEYILFHLETDSGKAFRLKEVEKLVGLVNFDWNYLACPAEKIPFLKEVGAF